MSDYYNVTSEDVLNFWFGGSWSENYKTKWFPSGEIQTETDKTIFTRFQVTLKSAISHEHDNWLSEGPKGYLSLIIVLDQFSRHIYRYLQLPSDSIERRQADSYAIQLAERLTSIVSWESSLSVAQHVFALMPFRHNATLTRLQEVIKSIDERESKEVESLTLINRFRKQTLRRLQHLEDRTKAESSLEILERYPFVADESNIMNETLVRTVESFLKRNLPSKTSSSVGISLSGGVDSMVIAKILYLLKGKLNISQIVAIHIDYANREESGREAEYVESWSRDLGFDFHVRTINEVTRGITDRTVYEKVARDIRYGFYQQIIASTSIPAVIFGHHMGDVQENVISNIMRGSSLLQLSGMVEVGVTNGVIVWRPLLSHPKSDIYDFAHKYGVPYFKDTTPSWSTRGKLRRQLVPLLTDMYGEGFLRNLANLAKESDEYLDLVQKNVFNPFLRSVSRYPCGLRVNILPYLSQSLSFWKEMLKELMHSMSMSLIRDKAVLNFQERIQRPVKSIVGWMELRKGYHTYLSLNGDLVIYRAGVLCEASSISRGNKPSKQSNDDVQCAYESNITSNSVPHPTDALANWVPGHKIDTSSLSFETFVINIGVWTISAQIIRNVTDSPDIRTPSFKKFAQENLSEIEVSPLKNIEDLLPGDFEYCVAIPISLKCEFVVLMEHEEYLKPKKAPLSEERNRCLSVPQALAKLDMRLKLGLPLLTPVLIDDEVFHTSGCRVVKLKYRYSPLT